MARQPRIEYPGAFYHVITRGNQRQKTFRDDHDRWKYLEILAHLKEVNLFRLHAYVLMDNHVHLLLETGEHPLSRIMQRLGSGYTQYFNRRHKFVGHLFQGRYKAILCDKDSYLLELSRYLHLNPVRAKVVKDPGEYQWSSYGAYVQEKQCAPWMETAEVLQQLSGKGSEARKLYRKYVLEGLWGGHKEEDYELVDGRFLGEREFVEEIRARTEIAGEVRIRIKPEVFLRSACANLGKKRGEVIGAGKERGRVRARGAICYVARRRTDLSVKLLAESLGVDATCVSRSASRVERLVAEDKEMRKMVNAVASVLTNRKYHA